MSDSKCRLLPQTRVASIDSLRGFDMFWIIGGGALFETLPKIWKNPFTDTIKQQMEHVPWQGFRFEDLIFPLFLFIVGSSCAVVSGLLRQRRRMWRKR